MGDLMSTIKANDLTNTTGGIPTVKSQQLIPTAWVNFDGTGTVAIRDSENVSSITDNGVGLYNVNFTVAMANTNYCAVGGATTDSAGTGNIVDNDIALRTYETGLVKVRCYREADSAWYDPAIVTIIVLGGQA